MTAAPIAPAEPHEGSSEKRLFLKKALFLWTLAVVGAVLALPYTVALEHGAVIAAAQQKHMSTGMLLSLSVGQSLVILAVAVSAGLWAAGKLGLRTPLVDAVVFRTRTAAGSYVTLLFAAAAGVVTGILLLAADHWIFAPIPSVAEFLRTAGATGSSRNPWYGFLASFYGGLDEEILMRLGLLSLLALAFRWLTGMFGATYTAPLPTGVFWCANIATALLFGLGHLPATAAIAAITPALAARAIALNGAAGIVFAVLYRRFGLEWAIVSHFGCDIILHVV